MLGNENRVSAAIVTATWLACLLMLAGVAHTCSQERGGEPPIDNLPAQWDWTKAPLGLSKLPPVPDENPMTDAKIRLGRRLFFDPILSQDHSTSCASCHLPDHGFASPDKLAAGVGGKRGDRNVPTILNRGLGLTFFWDGRAQSLEEQALQPIISPHELANSIDVVIERLRGEETYVKQFADAFADGAHDSGESNSGRTAISPANLAQAIACFERTMIVGDSAVDRFRASQYASLNSLQRQGLWIFESRGKCWQCHSGENFSDELFHNTGVGFGQPDRDLGRIRVTNKTEDRHAMKTPTLRAIAHTAPYMHDGSMSTLREVVEFYNRGGSPADPELDRLIQPLQLSEVEIEALVEFLQALSPLEPFAR